MWRRNCTHWSLLDCREKLTSVQIKLSFSRIEINCKYFPNVVVIHSSDYLKDNILFSSVRKNCSEQNTINFKWCSVHMRKHENLTTIKNPPHFLLTNSIRLSPIYFLLFCFWIQYAQFTIFKKTKLFIKITMNYLQIFYFAPHLKKHALNRIVKTAHCNIGVPRCCFLKNIEKRTR